MIRYISLITIAAFSLSSCRSVYKPNAVNVPLLKEKGEAKFYISNDNLQASYAVSENTGIMLNGYYEKRNTTGDNDDYIENMGYLGEAGLGWFRTYDSDLSAEAYGGAGFGRVTIRERYTEENNSPVRKDFNANAFRLFVQPSVGYAGRIFEIAVTPRVCALKYFNVSASDYTAEEMRGYYFNNMEQPLWIFAEPALTLRGGYKWFKVQVQAGRSFKLNTKGLNNNGSLLNAGVIIDIAKWYND